jgi:hypothetical protein
LLQFHSIPTVCFALIKVRQKERGVGGGGGWGGLYLRLGQWWG